MSDIKVGDKVVRKVSARDKWWRDTVEKKGLPEDIVLTVGQVGEHALWFASITIVASKDAFDVVGHVDYNESDCIDKAVVTNKETYTGGSVDYYQVPVKNPTTAGRPSYIAECNDIIEALGMNYAEGNAFKAIWRRAAQRTLGLRKAGAKDDGLYDAEKVAFFGNRLVIQSKELKDGRD